MAMFEVIGRVMAHGSVLTTTCQCGHQAVFTRAQAVALFGYHAAPYDLRKALVCSRCGARDNASLSIKG
jgi:hypothetical protein